MNNLKWQELINNLDDVEGRKEFIKIAPSGLYTGKNVDGEDVITIVSQGFGMTVKTRHNNKPKWWECVDYDKFGDVECVTYEVAE